MEESADSISLNSRTSMASPSLESETFQLSSGNLGLNNGEFEIDGSAATVHGGDRVASSLPDRPGCISNGEHNQDFSKMGSFGSSSFNLMNMNDFAENLTGKSLESGYGFKDSSMFNNVRNPGLFSLDPEAISNGGNLLGSGFNINGDDGIINLAITEAGSKYFQDLLSLKNPRISKLIFDGVIEFIFKLMTNKYGSYLFQKLIESESESEDEENRLQMIIEKLTVPENYIYHASIDKYGSFSVKNLIKVLEKSPLIVEIVRALSIEFRKLMIDPIGPYVIMECLDVLDTKNNDLLYVEAIKNYQSLAMHGRGFLALNGLIVRIEGLRRDQLLNSISDQVAFLAQDRTGNSVVQCVIALRNPEISAKIFRNLEGYYVRLSMLEYCCLIVLQCLRSSAGMEHVIHEFIRSNELIVAARDRHGNYVVQAALQESKKSDSKLHEGLILKLQQHVDYLQDGYGRNVLTLMYSFSSV